MPIRIASAIFILYIIEKRSTLRSIITKFYKDSRPSRKAARKIMPYIPASGKYSFVRTSA